MRTPHAPGPILGRQTWRDLLFLHWRVPVEQVQRTLPPGLMVDTFAGDAWVGIVPFAMAQVRPRFLPPVPWVSWFLELNVRTYVRHTDGTTGVWFHSLDCNQPVAVEIARRAFHLPYQHADMSATRRSLPRAGSATACDYAYRCRRRDHDGPWWHYAWATGGEAALATDPLERFLVERYVLFSADRQGRLYRGQVSHAPYRVHRPTLHTHDTQPAALAGFTLLGAPASILAAEPVRVAIHPLRRLPSS